jgi:hypothetical protein
MAKKNKNGLYLIILLVLILVYVLNKYAFHPAPESNIDLNALQIDTAQIAGISIQKPDAQDAISLSLEEGQWYVKEGERQDLADFESVQSVLGTLQHLKIENLVGTNDSKWEAHKLTDSLAVRVRLSGTNDQVLKELFIGKFTFKQSEMQNIQQGRNQGVGLTYVRLAEEDASYIVEGYLPMAFNKSFDQWRNKNVVKLDKNKMEMIQFDYPADSGFVISKVAENKYLLNHADTLDLTKVNPLLNSLSNYKERKFADDFSNDGKSPLYSIRISGQKMKEVTVSCYEEGDHMTIQSTQYPNSSFEVKKDQLFKKLLKAKDSFFK